jgi:hypothetical protein
MGKIKIGLAVMLLAAVVLGQPQDGGKKHAGQSRKRAQRIQQSV